ncbi:MAG: hypothetical protein K0Q73_1975 [Paenibacillus sp.]|jgi:hypothetical protein|nr:hypothetical protein [Paenibacillus sp.]
MESDRKRNGRCSGGLRPIAVFSKEIIQRGNVGRLPRLYRGSSANNKKSPAAGLSGSLNKRLSVFLRNAKEEKKPDGIYRVLGARRLSAGDSLGLPD